MNRYKDAGVDVEAGYDLVKRIKKDIAATSRPETSGTIGSFGGMFDLEKLGYQHPVLVSGTDGVGTKLMIAQEMGINDTIGIDCVAMCVNDVLAQGAEPLFFLDYIATGHNDPAKLAQVVHGVAEGCRQSGSALIGGETAEMPDMYPKNEYDLAGFSTGIANKEDILTQDLAKEGDILIGLPSTGVHSNGFSLIRQVLFKDHQLKVTDRPEALEGKSIGEILLTPTKIYVQAVLSLVKRHLLHGIAHITGGGLIENLPRTYTDDLQAEVNLGAWPVQAIFRYLQNKGQLKEQDCLNTFNMGIGLVLLVPKANVLQVKEQLKQKNEQYYEIGKLRKRPIGEKKIVFNGSFK